MMLTGHRGSSARPDEPRVVQLQISRYTRALPSTNEPLEFLVALHVEGAPTTWQRNAVLSRDAEQRILAGIDGLRRWSAGMGMTQRRVRSAVTDIGRTLRDTFLGRQGRDLLAELRPTALLLMVDETIIHLPWEMMLDRNGTPLVLTPFGRVVATRVVSPHGRDLTTENPVLKVLAVENPTGDLAAAERVVAVIEGLRDQSEGVTVEVTTLSGRQATRRGFVEAVTNHDFDVIHFAGHGRFDDARPTDGAVVLADGVFTDEHVMKLRWERPPFLIVNGSCESARAAPGHRVVSESRSNGLAAAFLGRGVEAYLGHYFFVDDGAAAEFSETFYRTLLERRNVGTAVQAARELSLDRYGSDADLTGFGAVFFGDAGTAERRDLATKA